MPRSTNCCVEASCPDRAVAASAAKARGRVKQLGVTLVESLVVIVIAAILIALAVPSFGSLIARKRLEGVASELTTDLQYARSESVQRQTKVRLVTGSAGSCYTVHTWVDSWPSTAVCSCTATPVCSGGPVELKTVTLTSGTTLTAATTLEFEPLRGMSTASGVVDVGSTAGNWQLRSELTALGRVRTCSPSGLLGGYPTC